MKTSLANDFAVGRLETKEAILLQEYFRRGIYFYYSFKNNSKKSPPGKITVITGLY